MRDVCQSTVDEIVLSLGRGFQVNRFAAVPNYCAIETPFYYPDNTPVTLYVRDEGDGLIVSDLGQVTENAIAAGASNAAIISVLNKVAARLGIDTEDGEISISGSVSDIESRIGSLLSAIQSGAHIQVARKKTPQRQEFSITVETYLARHLWRFERNKEVVGKHRQFKVDYAVDRGPGVKQLLLSIFDPAPSSADSRLHRLFYEVTDYAEAQQDIDSSTRVPMRVLLNDTPQKTNDIHYRRVLEEFKERLPGYTVNWSDREDLLIAA